MWALVVISLGFLVAALIFFGLWRKNHTRGAGYELAIRRVVHEFGRIAIGNLSILAVRRGFTWSQPEPVISDRRSFWAVETFRVVSPKGDVIVELDITWVVPLLRMPQITLTRDTEGGLCTSTYPLADFQGALNEAEKALEAFAYRKRAVL